MSIVIIGGGPAGSAAGITLARRGFSVTIVEAKAFPRPKVCGEFLSPAVTRLVESIVGREALETAGARRVDRLVMQLGDREASWTMPEPAWTLSRRTLDDVLLARALKAGASVLQPERVATVEYDSEKADVGLASGRTLAADIVVHADGSGRHDPAGPARCRAGVVAMKCHLRMPRGTPGIRMRSAAGAYIGSVQVEGGLATCALVARKTLIARHKGDADAMLGALWPGYDPAWRGSEWLSSGVPASGYIRPGHARSFRIGNAAAAVEPVGGEGIGLAIWSGSLLGELLPEDCSNEGVLRRVQWRFAVAYRRRLRLRRPACRLAAESLMRPRLVRALWPLLSAPGLLLAPWYGLTGKRLRPAAGAGGEC